jgi:hypothetical protein
MANYLMVVSFAQACRLSSDNSVTNMPKGDIGDRGEEIPMSSETIVERPTDIRFGSLADNAGSWPAAVCPLL